MRVFVTGGAGYIGSVCVEELLNAGHEVMVFDNLSEGHRSAVDERAVFVEGDLENREKLFAHVVSYQPEAVIHFAGKALVGESMINPSIYYRTNVGCGINVLDAMVEAGCRKIVFSSTCATYGPPEVVPIVESTPQNPINPYGHSKLMFEQVLKWYEQVHGIVFTALRYFNAAGASQKFGEHHRVETHLIPKVIRVALGQLEKVQVFGNDYPTPDHTCIRDYIHVQDLASAHILALERTRSGAFNVGLGEGSSVLQVIEAVEKISGREVPYEIKPRRPGDPPKLVAASGKIRRELGWQPKRNRLIEIVETAWAWHCAHPDGYPD